MKPKIRNAIVNYIKSPVTLKDVAKEVGFSVNTVAKVLSGNSKQARISPVTAEKVRDAASRLGYVPNQIARILRAKHSGLVGVFVAAMTDPVYAAIAHSTLEGIPRRGYFPVLTVAEAGFDLCYEAWMRSRIDGLILCGTVAEIPSDFFENLALSGIPVVTAGCRYQGSDSNLTDDLVSSVQMANRFGMRLAIAHLRARKYRNIAHLVGPVNQSDAHERRVAYEEIVSDSQKPMVIHASADPEHLQIGYQGAEELWTSCPGRVDAIIAYDDLVAIGAMKWLTDHGIRIPEDVAVMGFDNLPHSQYSTPLLTTIQQPTDEIGITALDLLESRMKSGSKPRSVVLKPSLVVRQST